MVDKIKKYLLSLNNNLTPGNKVLLVVFAFALIYAIIASFIYEVGAIRNNDNQQVNFYSENIEQYSFDVNDEYKIKDVTSYSMFFSTERNFKEVILSMKNGEYESIYKIMSKDYRKKLNLSKEETISKLQKFYTDNFAGMAALNLRSLYQVENSNYYIAVFENKDGEDVRIVFYLDDTKSIYTLEYLDF